MRKAERRTARVRDIRFFSLGSYEATGGRRQHFGKCAWKICAAAGNSEYWRMGWSSGRASLWCAATVALIVCAPGVAKAAQEEPTGQRETFAVELFKNASGFRALDYL